MNTKSVFEVVSMPHRLLSPPAPAHPNTPHCRVPLWLLCFVSPYCVTGNLHPTFQPENKDESVVCNQTPILHPPRSAGMFS